MELDAEFYVCFLIVAAFVIACCWELSIFRKDDDSDSGASRVLDRKVILSKSQNSNYGERTVEKYHLIRSGFV